MPCDQESCAMKVFRAAAACNFRLDQATQRSTISSRRTEPANSKLRSKYAMKPAATKSASAQKIRYKRVLGNNWYSMKSIDPREVGSIKPCTTGWNCVGRITRTCRLKCVLEIAPRKICCSTPKCKRATTSSAESASTTVSDMEGSRPITSPQCRKFPRSHLWAACLLPPFRVQAGEKRRRSHTPRSLSGSCSCLSKKWWFLPHG